MFNFRKPRLTLADIDKADAGRFLQSYDVLNGSKSVGSIPEILGPTMSEVARLSDEDIAELLSRKDGKLRQMANSVQRTREAWRGPARWSLIVAALSFAVALAAFGRTL